MIKQINLNDESYKKFQAALVLTGEKEEIVMCKLMEEYAHKVFEGAIADKKTEFVESKILTTSTNEREQKRLFMRWFAGLSRNGRTYNPVTISGYASRLENACTDPAFDSVLVDNLFTITNLEEFLKIQKQLKECHGYASFDAKSHNGFTAALRKYEDFLRFQIGGDTSIASTITPNTYSKPTTVHRWTMEEDMICCKMFLEYYVVKKSNMDIVTFLQMLSKHVPNVSEGSLRMKIQNIKYLASVAGLENTAAITWLNQYSLQCQRAFVEAVKELSTR